METMLQAIRGAPRPPRLVNPAVPVELEAICQRCLEKSPARRYGSAAEAAGDLERFLAGEVVEAAPRGSWTRLRRWVGRETGLAVHLITLSLVALAKLGAFAATGARQDLLVTGGLALWIACCGGLHGLSRRWPHRRGVATAWGLLDVGFLTGLLLLASGIASPAMLGFPLVVLAAGLWLRRLPVLLTGAGALAGSLLLALDSWLWHPERRLSPDGYVIVGVGVLAAVLLVLHQVRRARAVARFR